MGVPTADLQRLLLDQLSFSLFLSLSSIFEVLFVSSRFIFVIIDWAFSMHDHIHPQSIDELQ
jgi:hypothetical protein